MKGHPMLKKFLMTLLLCLSWTQGILAHNETLTPQEAEAFMSDIGNEVVSILTNKALSKDQRAHQIRVILDTKFNMKSIAKFVLGRYWKQATPEEKKQFVALFESTTAATYATRFQDYTSEKLEITDTRAESDGGVTVLSRIIRPHGDPIVLHWKIFKKKGEIRVYDIILEGVSMSITQRSEYASLIQKEGGHVRALIQALATKERAR